MGKGEIACNEHFLLFPQCFLPFLNNFPPFLSNLKLLSAKSLSLEEYKFVVWERVKEIVEDGHKVILTAVAS